MCLNLRKHLHTFSKWLFFSMFINKELACFSIINSMWNCGLCLRLVDGGWVFNKNFKQWTLINIWVHKMVLLWLLCLFIIFWTCCCLKIAARRGSLGQRVTCRGSAYTFFQDNIFYILVSTMQYFTLNKTHNIILFPCVLLASPFWKTA